MRLLILIAALAGCWYLATTAFEWHRPTAQLAHPIAALGRSSTIDVQLQDRGTGLHWSRVELDGAKGRVVLAQQEYPAASWLRSSVDRTVLTVPVSRALPGLAEGPATLRVFADDYSWLRAFRGERPLLEQPVTVDLTPPTIEILSQQHYLKVGGLDFLVYKPSPDTDRSGVVVDRYFFPGTAGLFEDPAITVAFFAVPQDLDARAVPKAVAEDAAGNRRDVNFHAAVKPRRFPERTLEIDDAFLARKVPEILEASGLPGEPDLVAGYLRINRDLRKASEERIREVTAVSAPHPLWDGAFLRQPNSAPLAGFGDRRSYRHQGKIIDAQTHLGFDLASLRQSPVVAATVGKVVFTGYLGIYGNTVIIDHGLGISSLYGHLSAIDVAVGQELARGDVLGRTGETGLAAGDHLHFSVMLWGVHVDPVEWWDGHWIHDHVTAKLELFPRATVTAQSVR